MDKKLLIGILLSLATGGLAVLAIVSFKFARSHKVKRERKQLKRYVKKYFKGNEKLLSVVDGLSNFEIRILFKIVEKASEKVSEIHLPDSLSEKFSSVLAG